MNGAPAAKELDRRFAIPGTAHVVEGSGGLAKVQISSAEATGEMYLHGAHVTSWKPRGAEEVLFVSSASCWEDGRAIRGGVPTCFPWFAGRAGDPTAPAHGFVRTKAWQLESIVQRGDTVTVRMFTDSNESTRSFWPADFHLVHRATFGSELTLELVLTNTGAAPLRFEEALHTYLRLGHIDKVRLQGLDDVRYLDKTDLNREKIQDGEIVIVSETDRVYLNTRHAIDVLDHVLRRRIRIAKENSLTAVVWNPWVEKAKTLSDLGAGDWKHMICVEASNVADFAVTLAPGQEHQMQAIISVAEL
jgi:glucose-6-phosphate 1-epimerase